MNSKIVFYSAFVIAPLVMLAAVYLWRPKRLWLTLPFALAIDVIVCWGNLGYYESRGLTILFIAAHLALIAAAAALLWSLAKGKGR